MQLNFIKRVFGKVVQSEVAPPGEVALSCNPSYWEARTVGWTEVERPLQSHR
jgi:hypothetical protein